MFEILRLSDAIMRNTRRHFPYGLFTVPYVGRREGSFEDRVRVSIMGMALEFAGVKPKKRYGKHVMWEWVPVGHDGCKFPGQIIRNHYPYLMDYNKDPQTGDYMKIADVVLRMEMRGDPLKNIIEWLRERGM